MKRRNAFRLVGVLLVALLWAPAASAAEGAGPPTPNFALAKPATAKAGLSAAEIQAYWTPGRMAAADGFEVPDSLPATTQGPAFPSTTSSPTISGRPFGGTPRVGITRDAPADRTVRSGTARGPASAIRPDVSPCCNYQLPYYGWDYLRTPYIPAVGRLYFTSGAGSAWDNACSGTLVAANIVLTAAHCIVDTYGNFYRNFAFVPGQFGGNAPYGVFPWKPGAATAWNYYYTVDDPDAPNAPNDPIFGFGPMDYAFIKLNSSPGVSPWPIYYNSQGGQIYHMGYPASGGWSTYCPFNSRSLSDFTCYVWYCHSPVGGYDNDYTDWWEVGIGCATSGGSSGGPWFQLIGGNWYVTSVMSTIQTGTGFSNAWGPYLNDFRDHNIDTRGLFNYATTL